jgi:hypothetical protein
LLPITLCCCRLPSPDGQILQLTRSLHDNRVCHALLRSQEWSLARANAFNPSISGPNYVSPSLSLIPNECIKTFCFAYGCPMHATPGYSGQQFEGRMFGRSSPGSMLGNWPIALTMTASDIVAPDVRYRHSGSSGVCVCCTCTGQGCLFTNRQATLARKVLKTLVRYISTEKKET